MMPAHDLIYLVNIRGDILPPPRRDLDVLDRYFTRRDDFHKNQPPEKRPKDVIVYQCLRSQALSGADANKILNYFERKGYLMHITSLHTLTEQGAARLEDFLQQRMQQRMQRQG